MPDKVQITVTVSEDHGEMTVDLNPQEIIDLRSSDRVETIHIAFAGERVLEMDRIATTALPPNPDLN